MPPYGRLTALYLLALTGPAHSVDCGRAITQFQFKAEDLRGYIQQSDAVITQLQATATPPQRLTLEWLIPFVFSIEASRSLLTVYRLAPECFSFNTRDIENGIAERERILNGVAAIVRGNLRGLRPP